MLMLVSLFYLESTNLVRVVGAIYRKVGFVWILFKGYLLYLYFQSEVESSQQHESLTTVYKF